MPHETCWKFRIVGTTEPSALLALARPRLRPAQGASGTRLRFSCHTPARFRPRPTPLGRTRTPLSFASPRRVLRAETDPRTRPIPRSRPTPGGSSRMARSSALPPHLPHLQRSSLLASPRSRPAHGGRGLSLPPSPPHPSLLEAKAIAERSQPKVALLPQRRPPSWADTGRQAQADTLLPTHASPRRRPTPEGRSTEALLPHRSTVPSSPPVATPPGLREGRCRGATTRELQTRCPASRQTSARPRSEPAQKGRGTWTQPQP